MSAATDRWREAREDAAENGCNCDPTGSGEEWCLGTCFLSDRGDTLAAILDRLERVAKQRQPEAYCGSASVAWAEVLRIVREGEGS